MASVDAHHPAHAHGAKRKAILYIGNMFSRQHRGVTVIEILGPCLEERYEVHYASARRSRLMRLAEMLGTIIALRHRVSVVLIDTYSTLSFLYALIAARLCRLFSIPYIPILHGGNLPSRLERSPRASADLFHHAHINVAPSAYLQRAFRRRDYPVIRIPNIIALDDCPFRRRDACRPRLLYVRGFAAVYNPLMAVRVLAQLLTHYPDADLCMIGPDRDGMLEAAKGLAARLGCADRITFTGQLDKRDWHHRSEDYDILVNTPDFDNMPVSVIEAMALGLPVVSTNPGGIPDLIEDGTDGLLVPCGDAQTMAERIGYLVENPDVAVALADNARRKAELFDWRVVKSLWFELLDQIPDAA